MHAHHKKFTRRFLANQPWKNPHGENQSERRVLINFFSNVQDRKIVKIQLISTGKLLHKVWKICAQQTSQHSFSFSVQNRCKCTAPAGRTPPSKTVPKIRPYNSPYSSPYQQSVPALNDPVPSSKSVQELNAPYSKNQQSVHPSKTVPNLMHRTAEVNSAVHPRKLCKKIKQTVQQSVLLLGIRASKILNQSRPPCSLKKLFSNQSGKIVASSSKLDLLSFNSSLLLKNEK